MSIWVDAVKQGEDTSELWPVNAAETLANADALAARIAFIEERILDGGSDED